METLELELPFYSVECTLKEESYKVESYIRKTYKTLAEAENKYHELKNSVTYKSLRVVKEITGYVMDEEVIHYANDKEDY